MVIWDQLIQKVGRTMARRKIAPLVESIPIAERYSIGSGPRKTEEGEAVGERPCEGRGEIAGIAVIEGKVVRASGHTQNEKYGPSRSADMPSLTICAVGYTDERVADNMRPPVRTNLTLRRVGSATGANAVFVGQ